VLLSKWSFETSQPTTAGPHAAEEGTGSATAATHSGASPYSSPVGNGTDHSWSATGWVGGSYFQFDWSLPNPRNQQELIFSFDAVGGATANGAPAIMTVESSYNGGPYQQLHFGAFSALSPPEPAWNSMTRSLTGRFAFEHVNAPLEVSSLSYRIYFLDPNGNLSNAFRVDSVSIEYEGVSEPATGPLAAAVAIGAIVRRRRS
jgi:hypothetical protein